MARENRITRRRLLAGAGVLSCASMQAFVRAHASSRGVRVDTVRTGVRRLQMHGGRGEIDVKFFFEPERPANPALLLQYDIPRGGSEGVHVHRAGGTEGAWDEFYYIVAGEGRMSIDGELLAVQAGDNIHTPLGVAHGIENTSSEGVLRVFLVAVSRDRSTQGEFK